MTWLPGVQRNPAPVTGGSFVGPVTIGVIHTTESSTFRPDDDSYFGHTSYPHVTFLPDDDLGYSDAVWQHIPLGVAARALQNRAGGVETNREGVVQIEVVARAADPSWSRGNGRAVRNFRRLMAEIEARTRIPHRCGVEFRAYPSSYGAQASQRMSGDQWESYEGWCGHQHVPENDHGDPGAVDIANLLAIDLEASMFCRLGDEGEAVEHWQLKLRDLGYYQASIDGQYGDKTAAAVLAARRAAGSSVESGNSITAHAKRQIDLLWTRWATDHAKAMQAHDRTTRQNKRIQALERMHYQPGTQNCTPHIPTIPGGQ